jgi:hypothetical protein
MDAIMLIYTTHQKYAAVPKYISIGSWSYFNQCDLCLVVCDNVLLCFGECRGVLYLQAFRHLS